MASISRWDDIFKHLRSHGFEVFSPGIKVGECNARYIVVVHSGSSRIAGFSSNEDVYDLLLYVPKQGYSQIEPFLLAVKSVMKELEPMVLPRGEETASFYDDTIEAHMVSVQYKNYKKMV